jgi:hypothetical protein
LVERCIAEAGISARAEMFKDSESMRLAIDPVEADREFDAYAALVHKALYGSVTITEELVRHKLLIALGALTMSSRRGSVRTIVTLNFDDVLEQYLALHGYWTQTVTDLPALLLDTDVTIYHPNGYLPSDRTKAPSTFLVLSQASFERRMSVYSTEWRRLVTEILASSVGLFVGVSGDDPIIGPVLQDVKRSVGARRPTGFWMRGPDDERGEEYFCDRNIAPLNFASYDDYPTFLFKVCQSAARALGA